MDTVSFSRTLKWTCWVMKSKEEFTSNGAYHNSCPKHVVAASMSLTLLTLPTHFPTLFTLTLSMWQLPQ